MKKGILLGILGICLVLLLTLGYVSRHSIKVAVATLTAHVGGSPSVSYPNVPVAGLSEAQKRILVITKNEYAKHPVSYDATVMHYTNGSKEAWCADFSSWVMREAGEPYTNPNSGGWRIPGVLSLQEYYQKHGRYNLVGRYQPRVGDVAFYIGRHDLFFNKQHVAIVISVSGSTMTTISGNDGGKMLIRTQSITASKNQLVGFGSLG